MPYIVTTHNSLIVIAIYCTYYQIVDLFPKPNITVKENLPAQLCSSFLSLHQRIGINILSKPIHPYPDLIRSTWFIRRRSTPAIQVEYWTAVIGLGSGIIVVPYGRTDSTRRCRIFELKSPSRSHQVLAEYLNPIDSRMKISRGSNTLVVVEGSLPRPIF